MLVARYAWMAKEIHGMHSDAWLRPHRHPSVLERCIIFFCTVQGGWRGANKSGRGNMMAQKLEHDRLRAEVVVMEEQRGQVAYEKQTLEGLAASHRGAIAAFEAASASIEQQKQVRCFCCYVSFLSGVLVDTANSYFCFSVSGSTRIRWSCLLQGGIHSAASVGFAFSV